MNSPVRLSATLKEVHYAPQKTAPLAAYPFADLVGGRLASRACFNLTVGDDKYGFSQWVSPKRTRSYPFARVYHTLASPNRITLIPFCKDEGRDGDRDFIQWDTVSLMSLLNVYVIVGYYSSAARNLRPLQRHKQKITAQAYDYAYVGGQIEELRRYQSSALHWNLKQMGQLPTVAEHTLNAYRAISEETGVTMHGEAGIEKRIAMLHRDINEFKDLSRVLAQEAQGRENQIVQPKEKIIGRKVSVTMKNLLGGRYFLTADEGARVGDDFFLIEKKHSRAGKLPSIEDILDSFIKMTLFVNIAGLELDGQALAPRAMVGLSSPVVAGCAHSRMADSAIDAFMRRNKFKDRQRRILSDAVLEARSNGFGLFVINSNEMHKQEEILREFR